MILNMIYNKEGGVIWITGLPGAGKTTIGLEVLEQFDNLLIFDVALEDRLAGAETALPRFPGVLLADVGATVLVHLCLALGANANRFLPAEVGPS